MSASPGATRRLRQRRATIDEIQQVARRLLVDDGATAVSLRGIAAEMGVSAPALYRYYPSRDDLVLAMVADLYDELTDTLERARDAARPASTLSRLVAVCRAFRRWSLAHPAEFGLVFANPIAASGPGSSTLVDTAGQRFGTVFVRLFVELWEGPGFAAPGDDDLDPRLLRQRRGDPGPVAGALPPGARWVFLRCWARLYGAVTLEVFGHLAWALDDLDPLFDDLMADLEAALAPPVDGGGPGRR